MDIRFHVDPETGQPHIYDHGVTEEEVRQVLMGQGDEFQGSRDARIRFGKTLAGRYLKGVFCARFGPRQRVCHHGLRPQRQGFESISPPTAKEIEVKKQTSASKRTRRKKQVYPRGWNEKRVRDVVAYYDRQTEDEELAEYEAGMQLERLRVMLVPRELVPQVNRLIKQRQGA
jgi:hypothetical protein